MVLQVIKIGREEGMWQSVSFQDLLILKKVTLYQLIIDRHLTIQKMITVQASSQRQDQSE